MIMRIKLYTQEYVELAEGLAADFDRLAVSSTIPNKLAYKIASPVESPSIERSARRAALKAASPQLASLKKFAFDTRRYDQETTRNPRSNLQDWHRSDQFIDEDTNQKVEIFAKLLEPLNQLKQTFGAQPEWHNSYARMLNDQVDRILRVKQADLDIFQPQLAYLEQLLFARYRLSMEELSRMKTAELKEIILKKDEDLIRRGAYLQMTGGMEKQSQIPLTMTKDGNQSAQESLVNAIFGNNGFRRDGEKTVERTITITIKDTVLE